MNDRFKFRVWDKVNSKMDDIYFLVEADTGKVFEDTHDVPGCRDIEEVECDRYILMQSTGLKDTTRTKEHPKGKLIFEGHIVEFQFHENVFHNTMSCQTCRSEVKYMDGGFVLDVAQIDCENVFLTWPISYYKIKEIEIIGNIHEHSHLLEKLNE